jgi:hypothetical protein
MNNKLIFTLTAFIFLIGFNESFGQKNYGWKKIFDDGTETQYMDTLKIDTVKNLIFFYVKTITYGEEFKQRNPGYPDSEYRCYYADVDDPSLVFHSEVSFYHDGRVILSPCHDCRLGPDLLNYGFGNIEFDIYYRMITGKSLILSGHNKKE